MKKLLISITCTVFAMHCYGQEKKPVVISAGIEFPNMVASHFANTTESSIPISAMLDIFATEKLSIRGYAGYSSVTAKQTDPFGVASVVHKYSCKIIGAGASYHFSFPNSPKFLPYVGGILAYNIVGHTLEGSVYGAPSSAGTTSANQSYGTFNFYAGTNYYFNPTVGVYAELGFGISLIKLGLCLNVGKK